MGDPAGIGPEIIVGVWPNRRVHGRLRPVVLGHPEILRRAARLLRSPVKVVEIASLEDLRSVGGDSVADSGPPARMPEIGVGDASRSDPQTIPCLRVVDDAALDVPPGQVDPRAGEAAYQAVRAATQMALDGRVRAIVTAPLSKAALHAAGHYYPGHTELLAEMCGVKDFAMMLYLPPGGPARGPVGLGVVHVTLHQSLRSVFDDLTSEAILVKCRLAHGVMQRLGAARPRVAVCALNPHGGEDGLFGDEEHTIIAPAVAAARREGIDAAGPFPTDTLMIRARDGQFDAVVAMFHDQGHIALKLLGMHAAVNVTVGLPIVRTSVAHGTAFDRAWQGTADSAGMVAALETAAKLALSPGQDGRAI
jgi:4-hydroxythreonine-4-phosphate dehydrogenase